MIHQKSRKIEPWFGRSIARNILTIIFMVLFALGLFARPAIMARGKIAPIGDHTVFRYPESKVKVGKYITPFEALVFDHTFYVLFTSATALIIIGLLNKRSETNH